MDEETRAAIREVRSETRMAAMCLTQCLALLVGDDPPKRAALDEGITRFEGMAESEGARTIMAIIRDCHDKMASAARRLIPDDEPPLA